MPLGCDIVTCIRMIERLDGPLSQVYYPFHSERAQVLFVQSDVSQKGSCRQTNRERERVHVSRLKGDPTLWGIRLSSLSWPGALPARRMHRGQFKGLVERPGACNTHAQTYASFFSLCLLCRQLSMSGFQEKKNISLISKLQNGSVTTQRTWPVEVDCRIKEPMFQLADLKIWRFEKI